MAFNSRLLLTASPEPCILHPRFDRLLLPSFLATTECPCAKVKVDAGNFEETKDKPCGIPLVCSIQQGWSESSSSSLMLMILPLILFLSSRLVSSSSRLPRSLFPPP
eukprot:760652-Hanusia_phi.AAC.1